VPSSARHSAQIEAIYAQDDPDACRHARSMVAALTSVPEAVRGDAMIVVTELVSNAVRHGRRVRGGRIVVTSVIECVRCSCSITWNRLRRRRCRLLERPRSSFPGRGFSRAESSGLALDLGIAAPAG